MFRIASINRSSVWFLIVVLTVITFPWSERLNSIGIIILILHWLIDRKLIHKCKDFLKSPLHDQESNSFRIIPGMLLWSFFFIHIIALLWSSHWPEGWQSIEVKLTFFILPVIFSTENYINEKRIEQLFLIFSISCCLSFCYSFGSSLYHYHHLGWKFFSNRMNVSEVVMHPGYYSNFFAYAFVWNVHQLYSYKSLSQGMRMIILFMIPILLFGLLILISKTAILFITVYFLYLLWQASSKIFNKTLQGIVFLFAMISFIFIGSKIPSVQLRIEEMIDNTRQLDQSVTLANSTGSRIVAWQYEWDLVKESLLWGYGTGEANPRLKERLMKEGYITLAKDDMHTHNQIFRTWLNTGIVGVLILLAILWVSASYFYQRKMHVPLLLIPLIFINLLTDDMLEIQAGTVFFIFFLTLFLYQRNKVMPK